MPRRPTTVIELQDALFSDTPAPSIPAPRTEPHVTKLNQTGHPCPPRRDKDWNERTPCAPTCIACGRPEPSEDAPAWPLCKATGGRHATVCTHTSDAYRADVCLITTHVHAQLAVLPETGLTVATVDCPHCGTLHAHAPTPGRHYRTGRCHTGRKPYIVHVPENRGAESHAEPQTGDAASRDAGSTPAIAPRPRTAVRGPQRRAHLRVGTHISVHHPHN